MEYVFGTKETTKGITEIVKTVGVSHSNLLGRVSVVREYDDRSIEDDFTVIRRYQTKKDSEGKCYDWYEIKDHFRTSERFTPARQEEMNEELEDHTAKIDYIAMMSDIDIGEV